MTTAGRILIVEDDPGLRETLIEVLADGGHEVRVAENGEAALAEMRAWTPELIVLDLMMPKMDGYAFRRAQRDVPGSDATRVLLLSAAPEVAGAAEELGADAFLVKPFGLHEVLDTIDDLLARPTAG